MRPLWAGSRAAMKRKKERIAESRALRDLALFLAVPLEVVRSADERSVNVGQEQIRRRAAEPFLGKSKE